MVPNHLFQLLALTAMEPPTCFAANAVRDEKSKLFSAPSSLGTAGRPIHAVRGQYGEGIVKDKHVNAYRCEGRVDPSQTETYVALKLLIDNWRWVGVPFCARANACPSVPAKYHPVQRGSVGDFPRHAGRAPDPIFGHTSSRMRVSRYKWGKSPWNEGAWIRWK